MVIGTGAEQPWDEPGQATVLSWIAGNNLALMMHKYKRFSLPPCRWPPHPFKHSGGLCRVPLLPPVKKQEKEEETWSCKAKIIFTVDIYSSSIQKFIFS